MLLGGRSSAAFVIEPGWESVLRVVRLGPSEGPALGNRAHMTLVEVIAAIRRGEAGPGWDVPGDGPAAELDPEAMLGALREDPAARDRRLVRLAQEVAEERERLSGGARGARRGARDRGRRARPAAARSVGAAPAAPAAEGRARAAPTRPPTCSALAAGAPAAEVERAYRDQVTRCHPDRVAGLHPAIRGQAEGLTVALNAARDLLLGRVPRRRAQRASG